MELLWLSQAKKLGVNGCIVNTRSIVNQKFMDILYDIKETEYNNICEAIKSVGNTNITAIDLKSYSYTVDNKRVSLSKLCTGELVFLVGELSRIENLHFYILDLVGQLNPDILREFFRRYKDCDIGIIVTDGRLHAYDTIEYYGEVEKVW